MNDQSLREFIFWGIWLVIPLLIDVISGVMGACFVLGQSYKKGKEELTYFPFVNILIPVYNSSNTLMNCLASVQNQNYPIRNISVFLLNNGIKDRAYEIYCKFQEENPGLKIWWIDSSKGKAKALNKGLYMAEGKYIINIDSDGILDQNAVKRVVEKFERKPNINAMTGVVLTDKNLIDETSSFPLRLLQRCELFEYAESFLVGRGFQSMTNSIFTLAGAFSCYRKEAVLKTQLYNLETLGEDTHMTSQIREFQDGKIALCENAFFYVDPVENADKLYIQRQRWQRGQVEVSSLFRNLVKNERKGLFNVLNYTILKDHTLVFPRFMWIFASMYIVFLGYPLSLIVGANLMMYIVYVLSSILYYLASKPYLKDMNGDAKYMDKHLYVVIFLPLYRSIVFFMRVAGIINSVERVATWNTKTFTEEKRLVTEKLTRRMRWFYRVKEWVNHE